MKYNFLAIFSFIIIINIGFFSCNKNEGEGGTGTIEGKVFLVQHPDDNYNLETDTVIGAKVDVFIVFGEDIYFGNDVETNSNGVFRFEYLKKGTYTVFAYSELATGERIAVSKTITIKNGASANVGDIYIHEGKAYGTSMIKGTVWATYFDKNGNTWEDWAYEHRVYIKKADEPYHFDDARVGIDGVFMFQKLLPGSYQIYTITVDGNEIPSVIQIDVEVAEPDIIIEVEQMNVNIKV